jgi:hypothetical protein
MAHTPFNRIYYKELPAFVCNVKDDQREQVKKLSIIIVILMNNWVQGNSVVPENVPPAIN